MSQTSVMAFAGQLQQASSSGARHGQAVSQSAPSTPRHTSNNRSESALAKLRALQTPPSQRTSPASGKRAFEQLASHPSSKTHTPTHTPTQTKEERVKPTFTSVVEAAERQRLESELQEMLSNPIRFQTTEFKPRAVKYTPINGVHNGQVNIKRAEGAAGNGEAGPSRSSPMPNRKRLRTTSELSDEERERIHASPRGTPSSRSSDGSTKELYAHKLSLKMPGSVGAEGAGLHNFGNTCYLNSVLQSLVHIPPLAYTLLEHNLSQLRGPLGGATRPFDALEAMQEVAHRILVQRKTSAPSEFHQKLKSYAKTLRRGCQEDAHEFLRFLLEAMQAACLVRAAGRLKSEDPLNRTTLVHKIFGGRLRSRVTCLRCHHNSDTFDPLLDISVDIRNGGSTLQSALDAFTRTEQIHAQGNSRYLCEGCKKRVDASKRMSIDEAPTVLTVHLKRFTIFGSKMSKLVDYPQKLVLSPRHMSEGSAASKAAQGQGQRYNLLAVIHHYGNSPNSGHYIAQVKAPKGDRWVEMNDSSVMPMRPPFTQGIASDRSAYILFYVAEPQSLADAISAKPLAATSIQRPLSDASQQRAAPLGLGLPPKRRLLPSASDEEEEEEEKDEQAEDVGEQHIVQSEKTTFDLAKRQKEQEARSSDQRHKKKKHRHSTGSLASAMASPYVTGGHAGRSSAFGEPINGSSFYASGGPAAKQSRQSHGMNEARSHMHMHTHTHSHNRHSYSHSSDRIDFRPRSIDRARGSFKSRMKGR